MRGLVTVVLLGAATLHCGSWKRVGTQDSPGPADQLTQLVNVPNYYQRLGRLAAGEPLPFVGTVAFAAGPADSVITLIGVSLENRALAFQREGVRPVELTRDEIVRVPTFQETLRAEESVLFQQILRLLPGDYNVTVTLRDASSTAESRAQGRYTAPRFQPGTTSAPILAYQATGRGSRTGLSRKAGMWSRKPTASSRSGSRRRSSARAGARCSCERCEDRRSPACAAGASWRRGEAGVSSCRDEG